MRTWSTPPAIAVPGTLRTEVGGHPLVARLLAQRGITEPQRARAFLDPEYYTPASPQALPGMDEAIQLIQESIARKQLMRVWGDFDVDGQSATALLVDALHAAGARVSYALPLRREGHGLNERAVRQAAADGVSLLVTCDTGISDAEMVALANALGLKVIITDHHDLPERLPQALAIVNSKLLQPGHPCYELSGAGIAFYLARALLEGSAAADKLDDLMALAALGLVADVAYQVDDVRYLLQKGIESLRRTQRPGLRAVYLTAQIDASRLDEDDIGFRIAPRLNAAGRLADASIALSLLITEDTLEAQALAEQLEVLNRERQALTESTVQAVERRLQQDPARLHQPVLIVDGDGWDEGILGLAASTLVQRYQRPAIVIAHQKGRSSTGSARSIAGIDIHQAIASQHHLLLGEGGHPMAAGFTIAPENTGRFTQGVLEWVQSNHVAVQPLETLPIDAHLAWQDVSLSLAHQVARLSPFGSGNPRPVFSTTSMFLRSEDISRRQNTPHRRLYLVDAEGRQLSFSWFNAADEAMPEPGQVVDLAFYLQTDFWGGSERLGLVLVDWRSHNHNVEVAPEIDFTAGFELVDWRQAGNLQQLIERLKNEYGSTCVFWEEGTHSLAGAALARSQLAALETQPIALAVVTPPPSPEVFQRVLAHAKPHVLILLPGIDPPDVTPQEFITTIAGMVRSAIIDPQRQGMLDIERMAAKLGAREEAVAAALRGLEASHVFCLAEADGLRAIRNDESQPCNAPGEPDSPDDDTSRESAINQARQALLYQLRETRAFRRAYRSMNFRALVANGAPQAGGEVV